MRRIERFPFVPADPTRLAQDCYEAYNIQVAGLAKRLEATGTRKAVIGVSGGLDSTHALIVIAEAFDRLGYPRSDILAYTLPGFATSNATKTNAHALDEGPGLHGRRDRHPPGRQARCSPDMDHPFANGRARSTTSPSRTCRPACAPTTCSGSPTSAGGIVVGTGDLSELALGWCTYGVGDQMSHYAVNCRRAQDPDPAPDPLGDRAATRSGRTRRAPSSAVLDTEISPELVPGGPGRQPPEHGGDDRPLRAAGLQPVLHAPPRLPALEDRLPGAPRLGRPGAR
ncbi:hypothetical protein ACU4GA_07630 [Methylobacterium oryzae CBMB20]